jgi:hypothetical protein
MIYLAVLTDIIHALLMVLWMLGMPLLFWHRYPRLSIVYCCFCLAFIVVNQVSQWVLGECIFTTIANYFYTRSDMAFPKEWFTVRLAMIVFGLTPTHWIIKIATQILVSASAIGAIYTIATRFKNSGK